MSFFLPRLVARTAPIRGQIRRFASETQFPGADKSTFVKERAAVKEHAASSAELWRKFSFYAVPPVLIAAGVNAYILWNEHWEHWAHMPPLEERTEYSYQNIRVKNYPWGEGDKTAFWNDEVNYHNPNK